MNDKEKRIYDEIIDDLIKNTKNKIWKWILEDEDGDYDIAIVELEGVLDHIIYYEKGSCNYDDEMIQVYTNSLCRLNDLLESIQWDTEI